MRPATFDPLSAPAPGARAPHYADNTIRRESLATCVKMRVLCAVLTLCAAVAAAGGCELRPGAGAGAGDKSPGDNFYRLLVNGEVERYAPGQRYVVTLVGARTAAVVQQFARFKLTLEPLAPRAARPPARLGQFQLFADTLTRFDEECTNSVVEADDLPKTEVQVMWKAPPPGSGCVLLKAMVYENASRWFAEDGQLTRRVCEDTSLSAPDCCACDDATYKMVFEGLWSPATHPKDFPTQALWLTHFSDVIGATHPKNFTFWGEGQIATDGFRSLAEWGSVGLLERELRQRGQLLRSIVKAGGLWHPRVNGNTSAVFTVDRARHLLSLASMFGPSPDWVVGVSGLELCRADCSWLEGAVLDLYPYDAGTDSGISYMSPNAETVPREKMYKITPMYPEDPRAPFYKPGGTIAPMARLYITRDKLISRSCDEAVLQAQVTEERENTQAVDRPECAVTAWSAWSACSVSCGKGLRTRTRQYAAPPAAAAAACDRQLIAKEMCVAPVPECQNEEPAGGGGGGGGEQEPPPLSESDEICRTSPWSAWSECSVTCGIGAATRRRYFLHRMGPKKCPLVQIEESRKCMEPAACPEEAGAGAGAGAGAEDPACPATAWSGWSPCSASCGRGVQFRTRLLLVPAARQQECGARTELMQHRPCQDTPDCRLDMLTAKRICMEPAEVGPCRGLYRRWTFVPAKGMCVPFEYGGCRGSRNNFLTQQDCLDTCALLLGGGGAAAGAGGAQGVAAPAAVANTVDGPTLGSSTECEYSAWGDWSRCSVSCGTGYQARTRTLLSEAAAGSPPCDKPLQRRRRCYRRC